jgi:hypothetical protein
MLAETMADHKESEKLPSELVTTLETIDDLITAARSRRSSIPFRRIAASSISGAVSRLPAGAARSTRSTRASTR